VGDRTDHGGVVIQGSSMSDTHGKSVSRVGDQVTCPLRGHGGVTIIVSGDPTFIVDGQAVARHGDKTSCRAMLIASQVVAYVDNSSGVNRVTSPAKAGLSSAMSDSVVGDVGASESDAAFDQHFALADDVTGKPLANRLYRTSWSGGSVEGRTDGAGMTETVAAAGVEAATIEVFAEAA
jgi:uncharacterized Zn-binding protein involved in type VI secretion